MFRIESRLRSPASRTKRVSRVSTFDVFWAAISPLLAYIIRSGGIDGADAIATYCGVAFLTSVATFQLFELGRPMSRFFSAADAVEIAKACAISVSIAGALLFTFTRMEQTPRSIPLIHYFLLTGGLIAGRTIARIQHGWRHGGKADTAGGPLENIVVVGASRLALFYTRMIEEFCADDAQVIAILDERAEFQNRSLNGRLIAGSPLHIFKVFDEYAVHGIEINRIVVAIPLEDVSDDARIELSRIAQERSIELEILPSRLLLSSRVTHPILQTAGQNGFGDVAARPIWKFKRIVDGVLACAVMVAIAPVAAVVAVLVWIDVGHPIVFWQQRVGRLGRPLHVYKFRTMKAPFDNRGCALREEQRVSWIGRVLRATRLDEIPQLWNILRGDMSVVGPRPLLPVDQPKGLSVRLQVSPGLTGLAQIGGGKEITVEERNAVDEHYVRHVSVWLDLKIMLLTACVMVRGDRRNEALIASALADQRGSGGQRHALPTAPLLLAPDAPHDTDHCEAEVPFPGHAAVKNPRLPQVHPG